MSLVDKRQEFADALSGVVGVRGFPYRPTTPTKGDAWPLLGPLERSPTTMGFIATWSVRVFLPQDERQASAWIDENLEALDEALQPVAFVDRFEPIVISVGSSDGQYALEIIARSEL